MNTYFKNRRRALVERWRFACGLMIYLMRGSDLDR